MKKIVIYFLCLVLCSIWVSVALSSERPKPFGLEVGKTAYHECLNIIKARSWKY